MFHINEIQAAIPRLQLVHEGVSTAELAPSRGGMATSLVVGGEEVMFLDQESFADTSRNVRGGNPVLFPSPGKLVDDQWQRDGRSGSMKQHGFARTSAWRVIARETDGCAAVTLGLDSSGATLRDYPWDFRARYRYVLRGARLRIEMSFENTGDAVMPFGAGFHPYFFVPQDEKAGTTIATAATRGFDNVARKPIEFDGFDLTRKEVDMFLLDHGSSKSTLSRPGSQRTVVVEGSDEFSHWVVWTLEGRDFVCLEPWTCPGDALNTGDRLIHLPPGERHDLWLEIGAE